MNSTSQSYQTRMQRVLTYVDQNLGKDLALDTLSEVAAFSKYHFHRQFSASFGLSAHSYVQSARLKKAAYELAYRSDSITSISMDAGFEAPDAFARAFRQRIGLSPSEFRKSPDWARLREALESFELVRQKYVVTNFSAADVSVETVPSIAILSVSHVGSPRETGSTLRLFIEWRKSEGFSPSRYPTYSIYHNDPYSTSEAEYREDFCVGIEGTYETSCDEIKRSSIPGGRCAVVDVHGDADNLETAILYLYRDWLPASREEPRDFPIYCQRLSFFPDVPAHETLTQLYLPLR